MCWMMPVAKLKSHGSLDMLNKMQHCLQNISNNKFWGLGWQAWVMKLECNQVWTRNHANRTSADGPGHIASSVHSVLGPFLFHCKHLSYTAPQHHQAQCQVCGIPCTSATAYASNAQKRCSCCSALCRTLQVCHFWHLQGNICGWCFSSVWCICSLHTNRSKGMSHKWAGINSHDSEEKGTICTRIGAYIAHLQTLAWRKGRLVHLCPSCPQVSTHYSIFIHPHFKVHGVKPDCATW